MVRRYILFLFIWLFFGFILPPISRASCANDPECNVTGYSCDGYPEGTQCVAKCCVPPDGGGGGGGGAVMTCPSGTRLLCQLPLVLLIRCTTVNSFCSSGGYAACGAVCYSPTTNVYTDSYCSTSPGTNLAAACSICYCGSNCNVTALVRKFSFFPLLRTIIKEADRRLN